MHFLNVDNLKNISIHFVLNIQNVLNFHPFTLEVWKTVSLEFPEGGNMVITLEDSC